MQEQSSNPPLNDTAPTASTLTSHDQQHLITYIRLLDAEAEGADWKEAAEIVLNLDPDLEPDRVRHVWESHLARAHWMTESGYRHLVRGGVPH